MSGQFHTPAAFPEPQYPSNWRLGEPQRWSESGEMRTLFMHLPGFEKGPSSS